MDGSKSAIARRRGNAGPGYLAIGVKISAITAEASLDAPHGVFSTDARACGRGSATAGNGFEC